VLLTESAFWPVRVITRACEQSLSGKWMEWAKKLGEWSGDWMSRSWKKMRSRERSQSQKG